MTQHNKLNPPRTLLLGMLLSAFLLLLGGAGLSLARGHHARKARSTWFDGIDVSHHQGRINWKKVAKNSSVRFVYIKATQGSTIVDDRYSYNNRQARRHGLLVGAYHYFSSASTVQAQFNAFKRTARKADQDLIPVIDVEREAMRHWTPKQVRTNLKRMASLVKQYYGKAPIIYSQYAYYNDCLAPQFNKYWLFLAKYSKGHPVIKGKGHNNIWQFTERGTINGIKGHVDLNRLMAGTSLDDLKL